MVVVFIVLVIVVTVSNPGVIRVSWREKADPGVVIFHLGTASKFGEVQLKLTPPTVCSVRVEAVGLIYPLRSELSILCPDAEYEYPVRY